jgi:homoserine dehydrogenase
MKDAGCFDGSRDAGLWCAPVRDIHIGLLGLGNVGAGVLRILQENRDSIEARLAASVRIKRVLVRDPERARSVEISSSLLTTDASTILDDPDLRVVVELLGGIEPARTYVLRALQAGKHVVTANKALLAECGEEIFEEARRRGLSVYFEGSVAGGIPVLRALREGLASDRIESLVGIVNGTSNYILDAMARTGESYDTALAKAQEVGYAEADPTLDVGGGDAAHKLALLTLVSFGKRVDPSHIMTEGIEKITSFDIRMARELGYVIKSLAIADEVDGRPRLRVHPAFVPDDHVLAGVHGAYNAVAVQSRALGRSLYYGQGAGMMPTGVAVVSDIIEVCRDIVTFSESGPPAEAFSEIVTSEAHPLADLECENYLCVYVPNVPGVLGRVSSCLGGHGVSIQRMNQDTPGPGEPIEMVILTEKVAESKMQAAMAEIDTFEDLLRPTHRIRIHPREPEI